MDNVTSESKPAVRSIHSGRGKRRRRRTSSLDAELRQTARTIHEQGMADAYKAATLMIVSRKLDEIRGLLVASGLSTPVAMPLPRDVVATAAPSPPPAQVKNPCKLCGRAGIYKSKPNQFDRSGSWYCRIHMALGTSGEAEDAMDKHLTPAPPPPQQFSAPQSQPLVTPGTSQGLQSPGASSLAEAMMGAQVENE